MAFLSTKIHRFTILIGSNIFPLLVPTLVPMSLYGTCPISLLSVGLSLRFFDIWVTGHMGNGTHGQRVSWLISKIEMGYLG